MEDELIDVVDENENIIQTLPKSAVRKQNLLRRGGDFIVFNREGKVLIHKRAAQKVDEPNRWDFLTGGWVLSGESPEQAAIRELKEEVGIKVDAPEFILKFRFKNAQTNSNNLVYVYKITTDEKITPQKEEIAEYEWVRVQDLPHLMKERPFTSESIFLYKNDREKLFGKGDEGRAQ